MKYTSARETICKMPEVFDADKASKLDCVFQFNLTGEDGGSWNITVKNGTCDLQEGTHLKPTVTINTTVETWLKIINKELNAMTANMSGRVKTVGNVMIAQKVPVIFPL